MAKYIGVLCVYRESMMRETLSASLKLENGTELLWDRAPKQFEQVVTGTNNLVRIELELNDQMQRPRNVKLIEVIQ